MRLQTPAGSISERNAVICSRCGANLPDASQYCLKCGRAVSAAGDDPAHMLGAVDCSGCGAKLPPGSQFCSGCGQTVAGASSREAPLPPGPRKRPSALWLILPVVFFLLLWVAVSDNPGAQELKRLASLSHSETIAPAAFPVNPRSFSDYRFEVPAGARSVTVSGQFDSDGVGGHGEVEVYLLTDRDLVNWQSGYSPGAFYTSGRVTQGDIDVTLPSGEGSYCLVFNNNFSAHAAKSVHAAILLQYKRWWPLP